MGKLLACRICLVTEGKIFSLANPQLEKAYFNLTGVFNATDPWFVCYECAGLLLKFQEFYTKCAEGNRILSRFLLEKTKITKELIATVDRSKHNLTSNLSYSDKKIFSNNDVNDDDYVDEEYLDEELLNIPNSTNDGLMEFVNVDAYEDDFLKEHNSPVETGKSNENKLFDVDKTDIDFNKYFDVKILSPFEAFEAFEARKESAIFKSSRFKCNLCYRRFRTVFSLKKHNLRHTSYKYGLNMCDICLIRKFSISEVEDHKEKIHGTVYKCKICQIVMNSRNLAKSHIIWQHLRKKMTYECQYCPQKYEELLPFLIHVNSTHPEKFICELCGNTFHTSTDFSTHKKRNHPDSFVENCDKYHCKLCDVLFVSKEAYQRHLWKATRHVDFIRAKMEERKMSMTGKAEKETVCEMNSSQILQQMEERQNHAMEKAEKETICEVCDLPLRSKQLYYLHFREYHSDSKIALPKPKNHLCDICGRAYLTTHQLEEHKSTHIGMRKYQCNQCWKCFSDEWLLSVHLTTHPESTRFVCHVCGKAFGQKFNIRKHMSTHDDKPFHCVCSRKFKNKNVLNEHIRTVHRNALKTQEPTQKVKVNSKMAKAKQSVEKGLKRKITNKQENLSNSVKKLTWADKPKNTLCDICGKAFMTATRLREHMWIHTGEKMYKCDKCIKSFSFKPSLINHLATHYAINCHKCPICERPFARECHMKRHIATHTNDRPFECLCLKSFKNKSALNQHVNCVHSKKERIKKSVFEM